jgi:hypothetical protein
VRYFGYIRVSASDQNDLRQRLAKSGVAAADNGI